MSKNDGGPAFPIVHPDGMGDMCLEDIERSIPISAKLAYAIADAMIAERAE